jgi:integral membrane protein
VLSSIRLLRFIGISEGVSFLVLLLIAMPLKYFFGIPLAVKVVGWAHGVLFMLYILAVLLAIRAMKWNWLDILIALAASLAPAGTFFLDQGWKRRQLELQGNPDLSPQKAGPQA